VSSRRFHVVASMAKLFWVFSLLFWYNLWSSARGDKVRKQAIYREKIKKNKRDCVVVFVFHPLVHFLKVILRLQSSSNRKEPGS